ncbi:MAG TPA: hypothetical protein VF587_18285, partial [Solirubrobacteraceae bacterium]
GGVIFLVALAMPNGMGMGDAKLLFVMGLYLGAAVAPAAFIALVSGTVVGLAIVGRLGVQAGRKTAVPFGVFLALGAVAAIFVGDPMLDWYLTRV